MVAGVQELHACLSALGRVVLVPAHAARTLRALRPVTGGAVASSLARRPALVGSPSTAFALGPLWSQHAVGRAKGQRSVWCASGQKHGPAQPPAPASKTAFERAKQCGRIAQRSAHVCRVHSAYVEDEQHIDEAGGVGGWIQHKPLLLRWLGPEMVGRVPSAAGTPVTFSWPGDVPQMHVLVELQVLVELGSLLK